MNYNGIKTLSIGEIIDVVILGWEFKAKCGGVQFIIVRVVLCPKCLCPLKKEKEKNNKHIIVKSTCVKKIKEKKIEDNKL